MEEEQKKTLCAQLGIADDSLGFLLILIASVLLSFWATVIQRKGLCLTIQGDAGGAEALPDVYPLRRKAGAMVIGSLGFFLCLALNAWEQARREQDCVARQSAFTNLWASILVLAAAVIRFRDLTFTRQCTPPENGQSKPAQRETEAGTEGLDSTLPA